MFIKSPLSTSSAKPNVRKPRKAERVNKTRGKGLPFSIPSRKKKGKSSAKYGKKAGKKPVSSIPVNFSGSMKSMNPGKVVFWALLLGIGGFAYITHVFTTQQMLRELSETQREFDRVRMIYEDQALIYHRMTGPAEIYSRARQEGFTDSSPADHIIFVDP